MGLELEVKVSKKNPACKLENVLTFSGHANSWTGAGRKMGRASALAHGAVHHGILGWRGHVRAVDLVVAAFGREGAIRSRTVGT